MLYLTGIGTMGSPTIVHSLPSQAHGASAPAVILPLTTRSTATAYSARSGVGEDCSAVNAERRLG